ncbi:hypothetical protein SH139x_002761 [Planctomycetaceae bacterium SH139]
MPSRTHGNAFTVLCSGMQVIVGRPTLAQRIASSRCVDQNSFLYVGNFRVNLSDAVSVIKPQDRNLLYLAAGPSDRPNYASVPFDRVVLVDQAIPAIRVSEKVLSVRSDCTDFVWECISQGVKFDAVVIINEGCQEGGGSYPLHSDFFLGMLTQIVRENYVHLACPSYYETCFRSMRMNKRFLDIPFNNELINSSHSAYIDPEIFSSWGARSRVWLMRRSHRSRRFQVGGMTIYIRHASLWDEESSYDTFLIPYRLTRSHAFGKIPAYVRNRICTIRPLRSTADADFTSFTQFMTETRNKETRVAIAPWANGQYQEAIQAILSSPNPKLELHFCHLQQNDFADLYRFADQVESDLA